MKIFLAIELFPERGHGFIETAEGQEVYFDKNSLLGGGFGRLTVETEVDFVARRGKKGPQAGSVGVL